MKVTLPGSLSGYLAEGREVGAHLSGSREWRLFVVTADTVHLVVFYDNAEPFLPPISDAMRSADIPWVEGDNLVASYRIGGQAHPETALHISVGENFPERVRFESHRRVEKATGKVSDGSDESGE